MDRASIQAGDTTEQISERTKHAEMGTVMTSVQTSAGNEDFLASVIVPRTSSTRDITVLETAMQGLVQDAKHPVALELAATASSRHFLLRATSAMSQRHLADQVQVRYPQAIIRSVSQEDDRSLYRQRSGQGESIWEDFLSQVLPFWHGKPLRFVLDCTPFRDDATIVYLDSWFIRGSYRWPGSDARQEKWKRNNGALWRVCSIFIPHLEGTDCTLIADRGLAGFPLVKICRDRNWHYLLRVSKEHTCQRKMSKGWSLVPF